MKLNEKTNSKGKNFFKKVDPISFALVVLLGASASFAAFQLIWNGADAPVLNPNVPGTDENVATVGVINNPQWLDEVVMSPLGEETDVAVTTPFFDPEADTVEGIVDSLFLFTVGSRTVSEQSFGTSFSSGDEVADVVSVLSGVVSDVMTDEETTFRGTIVTIDHENGAQSVYTGLYNLAVSVGDEVEQGTVLGTTGLSQMEPDAGNVVHLEFLLNGENLNPEDVINQRLGDL